MIIGRSYGGVREEEADAWEWLGDPPMGEELIAGMDKQDRLLLRAEGNSLHLMDTDKLAMGRF